MEDEAKLHSPICSTFEALVVVRWLGMVMEKNEHSKAHLFLVRKTYGKIGESTEKYPSHNNIMCVSHSVVPSSLPPMDCSPPGFSVHGILQARILEWVVIPFSRGSSQSKN